MDEAVRKRGGGLERRRGVGAALGLGLPCLALSLLWLHGAACLDSPLAQSCKEDAECPAFSFCDTGKKHCVAYGKELGGCGDEEVNYNLGEQCDDGNREDGDGCSAGCRREIPWSCGDGVVDYAEGEQCDDAMQCDNGVPCLRNSHCLGIGAELCRQRDGDGCSAACLVEAPSGCGNAQVDLVSGEQCDDGSSCADGSACGEDADCAGIGPGRCAPRSGDGCSAACRIEHSAAECGDAEQADDERCDDGADRNGDICESDSCACSPACSCNLTCALTNTTALVVGGPGEYALVDGDATTEARLGGSGSLAAVGDALFYADARYNSIRRIDLAAEQVETVAGDNVSGTAGYLDSPSGLGARFDFDRGSMATDGRVIWIADDDNRVIRSMEVDFPHGVTTSVGHLYTGDGDCLHQDPEGYNCYQDSEQPDQVEFYVITDLAYQAGMVYTIDYSMHTLRRYDPGSGAVETVVGEPGEAGYVDGVGREARLYNPRALVADGSGLLYIMESQAVRVYHTTTGVLSTLLGVDYGYIDGALQDARTTRSYGMSADGTSLYWTEYGHNTVRQLYLLTGEVRTVAGFPTSGSCSDVGAYVEGVGNEARFECPTDVLFHFPSRSLFVLDAGNYVIRRID